MPDAPFAVAGAIAWFSVCGLAMLCGTWRECMGGVVVLIGYLLKFLLGLLLLDQTVLQFWLSDMVCLLGFFYLSWKAPHPWPLWAFGLQFCCVMTEVAAFFLGSRLMEWTFMTIEIAMGYGILLTLLAGTFAAIRAKKAVHGRDTQSHK